MLRWPKSSSTSRSHVEESPALSARRWLLETTFLIVLAFAVAQGTRAFAIQPFIVPSGSMIPTIELHNQLLVEKVTYRFIHPPSRGDVVVFDNPDPNNQVEKIFIKRVIATQGQTVDILDGKVWVDGNELDEPYVHGKVTAPGTIRTPITVPPGEVWLMGDNRPNSGDSRFFGPQPISHVRGRAFWTYWPPTEFGALD